MLLGRGDNALVHASIQGIGHAMRNTSHWLALQPPQHERLQVVLLSVPRSMQHTTQHFGHIRHKGLGCYPASAA